jgi:NCAIR mutase (PurE)-related protein
MSKNLEKILNAFHHGDLNLEEAVQSINRLYQKEKQVPELPVIFSCENMSPQEVHHKIEKLKEKFSTFGAIKASEEIFNYVRLNVPDLFYYDDGFTIFSKPPRAIDLLDKKIVLISNAYFGMDLLEEAFITARLCGIESYKIPNIGHFGSELRDVDKEIMKQAEFFIYVAGSTDPTIEWIATHYSQPVILVPVLRTQMPFIQQLNMLSSILSYHHPNILRTSLNGAHEAALMASYFLLNFRLS